MGQVVAGVFCAFVALNIVVAGCLCFDWKIVGQVVAGEFCAFVAFITVVAGDDSGGDLAASSSSSPASNCAIKNTECYFHSCQWMYLSIRSSSSLTNYHLAHTHTHARHT